ncbi:MAG: hypothetical protein ACR2QF_07030 [Geminicoccaceae bacterium]
MTRATFTAVTIAAWLLAASAITDPYWPNNAARVEAEQLQRMIDAAR